MSVLARFGILAGVEGFTVFDCHTGRSWGPFDSREEAEELRARLDDDRE